jgi:deoxyribodipyrimidine photo-lyase
MHVVWLKRDLRIRDHRPLAEATARGDVLPLYVYEPEVYESEYVHTSHLDFVNESLLELRDALRLRGGDLCVRVGRMPDVLDELSQHTPIEGLWAHEETGTMATFERDDRVRGWCKERSIPFAEFMQHGVWRGPHDRDGWAARWDELMAEEPAAKPDMIRTPPNIAMQDVRTADELGLTDPSKPEALRGGEALAWETLESFLTDRGVNYRKDMSSPVEGWSGCSRLSPYLAYGNISIREAWQRTREQFEMLRAKEAAGKPVDKRWFKSLKSFEGRLHWHCHFIQKLEDAPRLEFENMARSYDGMREDEFDEERFEAWKEGQTGYPMVDACMRCLHATGWLNFRMRAMLVSFSSYHLWLHWRRPSIWLAKHFLDFEPGIHFTQFQMQSGTTGINSIRMYSPAKQVSDHDPEGVFVRKWVPELADVPKKYLPNPEKMPEDLQREIGCVIGEDYPAPIVDHLERYREARSRIWAIKKTPEAKAEADRLYQKHGSRRRR